MKINRTCTGCNIEFPNTFEYFYRQGERTMSICKPCANKRSMDYYIANKEKMQLKFHLWQKNNKDKRRAIRRREKAKLAGVLNDNWTDEQLIKNYGTDCYLCNEPIDFDAPKQGPGSDYSYWPDHVIPYSKGGDNIITNVRPCHSKCNRSKNSKSYEEYMSEKESNND